MIRLTNKVNNRTVCILLHGASIKDVPKKALDGKDWCYMSINDFMPVENLMGVELEVILVASEMEIDRKYFDIALFLSRKPNNLFITTASALGELREKGEGFVKVYRNQLIVVNRPPLLSVPNSSNVARPNSVTILLSTLMKAGVKKIVILGMDGCKRELTIQQQKNTYVNLSMFDPDGKRKTAIALDTIMFNEYFPGFRGDNPCEIFNCSPGSHITVIPQITYKGLAEMS